MCAVSRHGLETSSFVGWEIKVAQSTDWNTLSIAHYSFCFMADYFQSSRCPNKKQIDQYRIHFIPL
jgi:hypothetical protein